MNDVANTCTRKEIVHVAWTQRLSTGLIGLLAIGLTRYRAPCAQAVTAGLQLCSDTLLPSLFPFFVLSGLTVELGIAQRAGILFSGVMHRVFRLPGSSASLFILGALGGYPTGARAVVQLYQAQQCHKEDAQRMLSLCNNCGPGFFLGIVGGVIFQNTLIGLILWLMHLLASLITAWLFRSKVFASDAPMSPPTTCKLHQALIKSVTGAVQSTLGICGFVLFFSVLICLFRETKLLAVGASLLHQVFPNAAFCEAISSGLMEVSCGITALATCDVTPALKGATAAFLLSFGGCSVFFQTMQQTELTDLKIAPAIKQKLVQAIIAAGCSYCLLQTRVASVAVFFPNMPVAPFTHIGISSGLYLLFCIVSLVNLRKSRYNKR